MFLFREAQKIVRKYYGQEQAKIKSAQMGFKKKFKTPSGLGDGHFEFKSEYRYCTNIPNTKQIQIVAFHYTTNIYIQTPNTFKSL